jgi:myo-inositol-1(or 4)-monophosphatase
MAHKNDLAQLLPKAKNAAFESCSCFYNKSGEETDLRVETKGPHDYLTQIDLFVSEYLVSALPKLLEDSVVISEESKDQHVSAPYRWIIDPIDGTNNLIYGLPFYAVSIGLVCEDKPVLGVVYHPSSGELFSAADHCGAFVENTLIPGRTAKAIRVNSETNMDKTIIMCETDPYFDRKTNPSIDLIKAVYKKCIDCRITGSAAVDMSYIAAGRAHVHFCRNLNTWDYTGGAAILMEAGGIASQWDGSPVSFETGKHTNLASSNKAIHEAMLEIVKNFI